jgi:predicted lactoylglutathione lyase
MNESSGRMLFVNLSVRDLKQSIDFFTKLGFRFDPNYTDEHASMMIISDEAFVMLLEESRFREFTKREICDTTTHSEGLFAFSCTSRQEVDEMVAKALDAGGKSAMDPQDHGFMYQSSFYDVDGHHWEVLWMDPNASAER